MTMDDARAWATLIGALASGVASVVAAWKAHGAQQAVKAQARATNAAVTAMQTREK